jgi:hypothetical protein
MSCRKGRYYYVNRRQGRHVVTEYLGCGDVGARLAEIVNAKRREKEAARQALRDEAQRAKELDALMAELRYAAEQAASTALVTAGLHRHRGCWRRRRSSLEG